MRAKTAVLERGVLLYTFASNVPLNDFMSNVSSHNFARSASTAPTIRKSNNVLGVQ